jgi:hypothetical protein
MQRISPLPRLLGNDHTDHKSVPRASEFGCLGRFSVAVVDDSFGDHIVV